MTRRSDLAALVVGHILGLAAIIVGWYAAAGEATPGHQTAWIATAGVGVIVAGAANAGWLARARRAVSRRRAAVLSFAALPAVSAEAPVSDGARPAVSGAGSRRSAAASLRSAAASARSSAAAPRLVAVRNGRFYHSDGCQLVAGKAVSASTKTAHARAGRQPCGVCEP